MRKLVYQSLEEKLARFRELETLLSDPTLFSDSRKLIPIVREYGQLLSFVNAHQALQNLDVEISEATSLLNSTDQDDRELATLVLTELHPQRKELSRKLEMLQAQGEPVLQERCVMEIHAGAGGEEAALFVSDLYSMYRKYAESENWTVETLSMSATAQGGFKGMVLGFSGTGAFSKLRQESGGHRVQRVPKTEAKGRIHTSAATVVVMLEPENVQIEIQPRDYRKETFTSQGPGGQHVNRTESAVRLTHFESGIVVTMSDGRCQHKNFAKALRVLKTRLFDQRDAEVTQKRAEQRKLMIGNGGISARIRTYNFPENRVTDHRLKMHASLGQVLSGDLAQFQIADSERNPSE